MATAEGPFATICLTAEPAVENAAPRSELAWKSMRADLAQAGVPEEVLAQVDPLLPDAHLNGEALFVVANAQGLLHVAHLAPAPPRDFGQWSAVPSLLPLIAWRQSWPAHVVVLADRRGADLVAHGWGTPDVEREAGGHDYPLARTGQGGWSQRRYAERAENTWEKNADDVAREVVRLVDQVCARLVIAAGDVRALQLLEEALPQEVVDKLEKISGGRSEDGSGQAIHRQAHQVLASTVNSDIEALVAKLDEELGQGDRAVEGPGPVLEAAWSTWR